MENFIVSEKNAIFDELRWFPQFADNYDTKKKQVLFTGVVFDRRRSFDGAKV